MRDPLGDVRELAATPRRARTPRTGRIEGLVGLGGGERLWYGSRNPSPMFGAERVLDHALPGQRAERVLAWVSLSVRRCADAGDTDQHAALLLGQRHPLGVEEHERWWLHGGEETVEHRVLIGAVLDPAGIAKGSARRPHPRARPVVDPLLVGDFLSLLAPHPAKRDARSRILREPQRDRLEIVVCAENPTPCTGGDRRREVPVSHEPHALAHAGREVRPEHIPVHPGVLVLHEVESLLADPFSARHEPLALGAAQIRPVQSVSCHGTRTERCRSAELIGKQLTQFFREFTSCGRKHDLSG